jgi:hypothetical protein
MNVLPWRVLSFLAVALTAIAIDVPAASGTMPGEVGKIGYTAIRADGVPTVWAVDPDGGGNDEIVAGPSMFGRFSPDGSQVVFARPNTSFFDAQLWVAPVDGSTVPVQVGGAGASQAAWSPEGNRLAYVRGTAVDGGDISYSLRVMHADGSGDRLVRELGISGSGANFELVSGVSWSPDGTRIATTQGTDGQTNVITVDPETGEAVNVTDPVTEPPSYSPSYHPDGSRLVYTSMRPNPSDPESWQSGIFSRPVGGGAETTVVPPGADARFPTYSPDGESVAFVYEMPQDGIALGTTPSSGGGAIQVVVPPSPERPMAFTPDWQSINEPDPPQPPAPRPPDPPAPNPPSSDPVSPSSSPTPGPSSDAHPGPGGSSPVTSGAPSPGESATSARLARVLRLSLTNRTFRVGRRPTPITAAAGRRSRNRSVAVGTQIRFRLSRSGPVRLAIQRRGRAGFRTVGVLRRQGRAGENRVWFTGRIGRHKLAPGRYRVVARSTATGRRTAAFTVVRGRAANRPRRDRAGLIGLVG